jgi:hypothetical protein
MQAGPFSLIVRDDRNDAFFTASDYLRQRLNKIRVEREAQGLQNPLPTFTDIEKSHINYLRGVYKPYVAVASEYIKVKSSGAPGKLTRQGGTATYTIPVYGHFLSDIVAHVRFADIGTATPVISPATPPSLRYRLCAYPGMRLFQHVEFTSGKQLIDDYNSFETSLYNKFRVTADRRPAWDRGMGQGELRWAEFFNNNGFTGCMPYKEGPQTQSYLHQVDLWVPLMFDFCQSPAQAICNDLIPNTQREIAIHLAPLEEIVQASNQTTGDAEALPFDSVDLTIDLYVNNLFTNPEVHDIFASRVGFSLVRVHRRQSKIITKPSDQIKMDQLKFPLEYAYLCFRDRANLDNFDQWHLCGRARTRTDEAALLAPAVIWNAALGLCQLVCRHAHEVSTLDPIIPRTGTIKFTAHGIDLFPAIAPAFYNTYLPQRYPGQTAIVAPSDTSALLATFCLFPGQYNPSGYYNMSAGRELYIGYTNADVSPARQAEMLVSASTLNFIVVRGDGASLRFSL